MACERQGSVAALSRAVLFLAVFAFAPGRLASAHEVNPVSKVVVLLGKLKDQLHADSEADATQYAEYNGVYEEQDADMKRVIEETSNDIADKKTFLSEQEALRTKKGQEMEKAANSLASSDKEKQDAIKNREKEKAEFNKVESECMEGVDSIDRSLEVMEKKMPDSFGQVAEHSMSLLDVAQKLKTTLEKGDITLTISQKQTLKDFVRAARRKHNQDRVLLPEAPDFLQLRGSSSLAVYDEYKNGNSDSNLVDTLESIKKQLKDQLEKARNDEATNSKNFKEFDNGISTEISNLKTEIASIKSTVGQSQEQTGKAQAELLQVTDLNEVTTVQHKQLEADHKIKTIGFQTRTKKRADEVLAVTEALDILKNSRMMKYGEHYTDVKKVEDVPEPVNFLQISNANRRKAAHLMRITQTPGVMLLALRTQTRVESWGKADPFGKVKGLIKDMLNKLTEEQASEAKKNEWCESELAKSTKDKHGKEMDINKLKDRIDAMEADLKETEAKLEQVKTDLADIEKATNEAVTVRNSERQEAESSIAKYREAQSGLNIALETLKKVYAAKAESEDDDSGFKLSDMGSGIVGLLEVAVEDFADLEQEMTLAEQTAQRDFKEMMNQNEVRVAAFNKDVEYNHAFKLKLEGDLLRAQSDMRSDLKELAAVNDYLKSLEGQCVAKVDSYEERKARREKELASLKEALEYLSMSN